MVQSVSNGFQAYVDHIQEDTLTSYPLTIMQESTNLVGTLLAMTADPNAKKEGDTVKEEQYISNILDNLSTNDLKSFNEYIEKNYSEVEQDISSIQYSYSVDPMIYVADTTNKIAKVNPSDLFSTAFGQISMMGTSASVYAQMVDDVEAIEDSYEVLAGNWPKNYDEMVIVLTEPNEISDFLLYYLGLRDTDELVDIVKKVMSGEKTEIHNEPLTFSYEDLMNVDLRLIMPTDLYQYNEQYDIYESMEEDEAYMQNLYNNGTRLKIVGIVSAKEGITTAAMNPGVAYTSKLVNHIIDYSANTEMVKKQLANDEVDVISGQRFDSKKNDLNLSFEDIISIDTDKLQKAFNVDIDQEAMQLETEAYMAEISDAITTDTTPAKEAVLSNLDTFANGIFSSINGTISLSEIDSVVESYLSSEESQNAMASLEEQYVVPQDVYKKMYSELLKGLLQIYINAYVAIDPSLTTDPANPTARIMNDMVPSVVSSYTSSTAIQGMADELAKGMTEAVMKKTILTKVGELTVNLTSSFASAFNVDEDAIADAFKPNITEEEITRIVTSMMSETESSAKTNLANLGYQNKEEPTYISFYFNSFDGKEHFIDFLDSYNEQKENNNEEDKVINYTDTTGILMGSVKTIVNAVTYVLIAFISISLIVSSIMIGIITYISVYERTKEIGILRAIGASKHNISSIFNAETFIIGLLSGLFGISVTYALIPIINTVLHAFTGNIPLNATFYLSNAVILVLLSVILTIIGGLIPAKAASKRDPVIALRTE